MVIRLDAKTGIVIANDYELQVRLTLNEFKTQHPSLTPIKQFNQFGGLRYTIFQLPILAINGEQSNFSLTYINQYINRMEFSPVFPDKFDADNEADQAVWRETQLRWIYAARTLLREAYGEPNSISRANVFDENEYPKEFRKELQCWNYTFRWGEAGLYYDDETGNHGVWINYNLFQQIRDWDELKEECELRVEIERQGVGSHFKYTDHLAITNDVINLIRSHFDYQTVKPMVHPTGLVFNLPKWKTRLVLYVHPERESENAKYEITRHDSVRREYTSDSQTLIDNLRLYMQSEKL